MRIKHWQGYGIVNAVKVKDKNHTLHVRVSGNHEWGLVRDDDYDLYHWLVKKFDKSVPEYRDWRKQLSMMLVIPGGAVDKSGMYVDACDYVFKY